MPTKFGQRMTIKKTRGSDLIWESLDANGESWFRSNISLFDFSPVKTTDEDISSNLKKFLKNAVRLNSEFLSKWNAFKVETQLDFPRDWGLGSSSTLIHNLAQWAGINPMMLGFRVSNGSGYDVACAGAEGPLLYQVNDDSVSYKEVEFNPSFKNKLYFVHLNQKQDSSAEVKKYTKEVKGKKDLATKISAITEAVLDCKSLDSFQSHIDKHEQILADALGYPTAKSKYFSDYWGSIKSLGAWGGDFILATSPKSEEETRAYFVKKGFATFLSWSGMVL